MINSNKSKEGNWANLAFSAEFRLWPLLKLRHQSSFKIFANFNLSNVMNFPSHYNFWLLEGVGWNSPLSKVGEQNSKLGLALSVKIWGPSKWGVTFKVGSNIQSGN